jgi:hypothetical protein
LAFHFDPFFFVFQISTFINILQPTFHMMFFVNFIQSYAIFLNFPFFLTYTSSTKKSILHNFDQWKIGNWWNPLLEKMIK